LELGIYESSKIEPLALLEIDCWCKESEMNIFEMHFLFQSCIITILGTWNAGTNSMHFG